MDGLRVGLKNKGFKVDKLAPKTLNKRVKVIREIISEVAGLAPYEKRVLDVIKTGGANAEKRSYKLAKQRLGTHKRALHKREQLKALYARQRSMK